MTRWIGVFFCRFIWGEVIYVQRKCAFKVCSIKLACIGRRGGAQSAGAVDLQFSGTLISAPKCTMSATAVTVDFGDRDIAKLTTGGGTFDSARVWYDPKCTNTQDASKFTVNLIFQGTPAIGNDKALSTDNTGLGILLKDAFGKVLEINTSFLVKDLANPPSIHAYPIKLNENVAGGTFKASGTLIFDIK